MISIKKLAITGAAAGLLLASAVPVFAGSPPRGGRGGDEGVKQSNDGAVINKVTFYADSSSTILATKGGEVEKVSVDTGNATANGVVKTELNKNVAVVKDCKCLDDGALSQKNHGFVKNEVGVYAYSYSDITASKGGEVEKVSVDTGNAKATGVVKSVVNENVVIVGGGHPK